MKKAYVSIRSCSHAIHFRLHLRLASSLRGAIVRLLFVYATSSSSTRSGSTQTLTARDASGREHTIRATHFVSSMALTDLFDCITPAAARTRIFDQMSEEHIGYMLAKIPRGRFLLPDEVASMVAFLASAENSFTTAGVFDLSGGRATY